MKHLRPLVLLAALTVLLTGCTPKAGQGCDPGKEKQYYSTHTENGKTTTVNLECKQVGIDRWEWRKA